MFSYSERGTDSAEGPAQWVSDLAEGKSQKILPQDQEHYMRREDRIATGRSKRKGSDGTVQ
jgi:hypothetical protein